MVLDNNVIRYPPQILRYQSDEYMYAMINKGYARIK